MANFLLRHLTETRKTIPTIQYSKYFGFKTPAILDRVIPNVPENLRNSTEAFIDALINCDEEFIQATSTGALQRKLMPEL